jgi:hypothetical protein
VGSFKPTKVTDSAKIYDVGGNVAEYYNDNGNLKTYGYSAYDFVDVNSTATNPKPAHTGFRLVKDQ